MKKRLVFAALSAALLLTACNGQPIIDGPAPSTLSDPASLTAESSTASTGGDASAAIELPTDPAKGDAYNAAVAAYNGFLSGKTAAKDKATGKSITATALESIGSDPGVGSAALLDMNGDGLPELHARGLVYHVFSYTDGQVVCWYSSDTTLMNGSVYPLENGTALFEKQVSTGTMYNYTTFDAEGNATTLGFFDAQSDEPDAPYSFGEQTSLSQTEWEALAGEYLTRAEHPAQMEWFRPDAEA